MLKEYKENFEIQQLKGVGPNLALRLKKLGIVSIQDLLFHLPLRYQDRTRIVPMGGLRPGDEVAIEGEIQLVQVIFRGRRSLVCTLSDNTGLIHLRFFHFSKAQQDSFVVGKRMRCFGEARLTKLGLEIAHPEYRFVASNALNEVEESLTPIYPSTEGVSQLMWRKLTRQALEYLKKELLLPELLPEALLKKLDFSSLQEALLYLHQPPPDADLNLLTNKRHPYQKRLIIEELLAHQLSLLQLRHGTQQYQAMSLKNSAEDLVAKFLNNLPFRLTGAQQKVLQEIQGDLLKSEPMLRLVQGDVGSGKTVVAASAALHAIQQGYQVALMAPTELLAEQHFKNFSHWFEKLAIPLAFLSGSVKTKARREALEKINNGTAKMVVGTHALFQEGVDFSKLALVIIDEQHRFGVHQRMALRNKGIHNEYYPHQLVMTATPIPRTLAMTAYADLDCSIIDELPPGRTPIKTIALINTRRAEVVQRIHQLCQSGYQAYWVCTLIEESEMLQAEAAEKTFIQLQTALPSLNIALIHGRMKATEKEMIMQAFKQKEYHLLVATTVIEVGVDVPNASLMVIENAERLGLSQLHQLRGRVGRGTAESHCVLLYQSPLSQTGKIRLETMRETTDGFKIAEKDLELRGPGEVLGTRQTGLVGMRIADLVRDQALIYTVQQAAKYFTDLESPLVKQLVQRWLSHLAEEYVKV